MNPLRFRLAFPSLLTGLVMLAPLASVRANYYELLRRVPESANTIIMIDVERLLMSPIAMKRNGAKSPMPPKDGCFTFHPTRCAACSPRSSTSCAISTTCGISRWSRRPNRFRCPTWLKAEGGYIDNLEGQEIAFSPRDAFFVSLKPNILGVSFPANRAGSRSLAAVAQAFR